MSTSFIASHLQSEKERSIVGFGEWKDIKVYYFRVFFVFIFLLAASSPVQTFPFLLLTYWQNTKKTSKRKSLSLR